MIGGKMMNGENIIHRYMINGGGGMISGNMIGAMERGGNMIGSNMIDSNIMDEMGMNYNFLSGHAIHQIMKIRT